MHTEERKKGVLETLYSRAGGNASKCARLTGVDRKTILKWKEELESSRKQQEDSGELPVPEAIKQRIIRRVYEIVETCTDPKKLMDTYEAISKFERETGHNKESLFDLIEKKLGEK